MHTGRAAECFRPRYMVAIVCGGLEMVDLQPEKSYKISKDLFFSN